MLFIIIINIQLLKYIIFSRLIVKFLMLKKQKGNQKYCIFSKIWSTKNKKVYGIGSNCNVNDIKEKRKLF